MFSEHSINGSIFLLINMTLNETSINLRKISNIENLLRQLNSPIAKGIVIIKKLLEIIGKKSDNDSYKLELIEVNNILDDLNTFQRLYDYEGSIFGKLYDDGYGDDFLSRVRVETLQHGNSECL